MKKTFMIAALIATAFTSTAYAQSTESVETSPVETVPVVAPVTSAESTAFSKFASAQKAGARGWYGKVSIGQASTKLDTSNTQHATRIDSDSTDKFAYELGVGYRYNDYVGAELSYVNFGKPSYNLTRQTDQTQSVMTVKNEAIVAAVRGYLPINEVWTATGRVGAAFVNTSVNRVAAPGNSANYSGSDRQVHLTYGVGVEYKLSDRVSALADVNWYPKITKTGDNSTDTDSYMVAVGIQYRF